MFAALCVLSLGAASSIVEVEPAGQLAAYEGRKMECWQSHVNRLGGCGTEQPLQGDSRRRLAVALANCQFEEDGLPVFPCEDTQPVSQCTAAIAASGTQHSYGVYSQHLLHVDVICLYLSAEAARREQKRGAAELLAAAQHSQRQLASLTGGVMQLGIDLEAHASSTKAAFAEAAESTAHLTKGIQHATTRVEEGFGEVGSTLRTHTMRLEGLHGSATAAADAVGRAHSLAAGIMRQQSEMSKAAQAHKEDLGAVFAALSQLEALHRSLTASFAAIEAVAFYAAVGLCTHICTATKHTAAARLPLILAITVTLTLERMYESLRPGICDDQRSAEVWMMRRLFVLAGVAFVVITGRRYSDPAEALKVAFTQLRDDTLLHLQTLSNKITELGVHRKPQRQPSVGRRCC
eukprot:Hpha_TRINITY_DN17862_c0_g1::TRINITY_DN17862_c0_g1_i1::g.177515::m.177515